jgi:predicted secreted protein
MKAVIIGLAVALTACAPKPSGEETAPVSNNSPVAAPTPDGVNLRITAAQAGQVVRVPVNQRFSVELVGVPTAGYVWAPATLPAFITRAGEATGPTIAAQNQPGYTGGNHWEVLMFAATAPGRGDLVIEQRRPWETNEPPTSTFRVTIEAQ